MREGLWAKLRGRRRRDVTARDGAFDSGTLGGGDVFSQTFGDSGTFDYFCAIHPSMTGTVTVTP